MHASGRPGSTDSRPSTVVAATAAVVTVVGVAAWFVPRSSLWLDEALSVNLAQLAPSELLEALGRDGHPPAYYLLLHAWMLVAGDSDLAVRALSGVWELWAWRGCSAVATGG